MSKNSSRILISGWLILFRISMSDRALLIPLLFFRWFLQPSLLKDHSFLIGGMFTIVEKLLKAAISSGVNFIIINR